MHGRWHETSKTKILSLSCNIYKFWANLYLCRRGRWKKPIIHTTKPRKWVTLLECNLVLSLQPASIFSKIRKDIWRESDLSLGNSNAASATNVGSPHIADDEIRKLPQRCNKCKANRFPYQMVCKHSDFKLRVTLYFGHMLTKLIVYLQRPLEKSESESTKPHQVDLCAKCKQVGYSCEDSTVCSVVWKFSSYSKIH